MLVSKEKEEQLKIERLIKKRLSKKDAERIEWGGDGKLRFVCKCGHINVMTKLNPTRYETDRWISKRKCPICGSFFLPQGLEDLTKYFAKYKPRKKICKQ